MVKTAFYYALQAVPADKIRFIHKLLDILIFSGFKALELGGIFFGYIPQLFACKNRDTDMRQNEKGNREMHTNRQNQQNDCYNHTNHKTDDHDP